MVLALVLAAGCEKDKGTDPGTPFVGERDTPEDLLQSWFERAYGTQDSARYEEMLDEAFEFEFLRVDAESLEARGVLEEGSRAWGKAPDIASTWKMFGSPYIGDITLDILVNSNTADTSCAGCRRIEATITLRVTTNPQAADPVILAVDSPQTFIVAKGPADTTLWVLRKQIDRERTFKHAVPQGAAGRDVSVAANAETSWGSIKSLFSS